jgi:hypothetical protein
MFMGATTLAWAQPAALLTQMCYVASTSDRSPPLPLSDPAPPALNVCILFPLIQRSAHTCGPFHATTPLPWMHKPCLEKSRVSPMPTTALVISTSYCDGGDEI